MPPMLRNSEEKPEHEQHRPDLQMHMRLRREVLRDVRDNFEWQRILKAVGTAYDLPLGHPFLVLVRRYQLPDDYDEQLLEQIQTLERIEADRSLVCFNSPFDQSANRFSVSVWGDSEATAELREQIDDFYEVECYYASELADGTGVAFRRVL
jgi:hypothetical protein